MSHKVNAIISSDNVKWKYINIPDELKKLPQWVCANENKVPINPRTGHAASVINAGDWASFHEAAAANYPYIGFVLTKEDPYAIIDLDNKPHKPASEQQLDRHQKILEAFQSYTERSASGTGYHIIVRGTIMAGLHRDNVEVYSDSRYMICTGDVVRGGEIKEYQEYLDVLSKEMQPIVRHELDESFRSNVSDADLVETAQNAANGDKFDQLCIGEWEAMGYESQSEADFALLSILAFYTMDNDQVRRIFRYSKLGKREKATKNDKYLDLSLAKIRANQPSLVDISGFLVAANEAFSRNQNLIIHDDRRVDDYSISEVGDRCPPGLVGEIAKYFYETAIRPVWEVAISAALTLMAGIAGRSFNVSGTGLNLYVVLLAGTGIGKEGAASGISKIMNSCRKLVPDIDRFDGPGTFASGQALLKVLDEKPSFFSILGEFGLSLQHMSDVRANSSQIMMRRVLLDLYTKSGCGDFLRPMAYSDTDKNTALVRAPSVSILGESTPHAFFSGLSEGHISEGLIPRFLFVEYKGGRKPRNKRSGTKPPEKLVKKLSELAKFSLKKGVDGDCIDVGLTVEADKVLSDFDSYADSRINAREGEVEIQLWNRAHLNSLKLSALLAVGENFENPIVTKDMASWAVAAVRRSIDCITGHFENGDIGEGGDSEILNILRRKIGEIVSNSNASSGEVGGMVRKSSIQTKVSSLAAFKKHKAGAVGALKMGLQVLVENEELVLLDAPAKAHLLGQRTEAVVYVLGSMWGKIK